jgi:hypothetical protein
VQQAYRRLVKDFCALAALDDASAIAEGCSFSVDDIECALIYLDHISPDQIYCYIDFGLAPEARRAEIYRHLLNANYLQLTSASAIFTVSPETDHVVLISTLQLAEASPETLADLLAYHAQQALEWRRSYYLDEAADDSPGAIDDAPIRFA